MLIRGRISKDEYSKLMKACTYESCEGMLNDLQLKSGSYPVLESMFAFAIEHWDEILKVLITVAALLMDGKDE
jgi:hypothetical protein